MRHQCYDQFLVQLLPKDGRIFSIASERAINEMNLTSDGYQLICSDLDPVCLEETERLFPQYQFMRWDALNDPLPAQRFDAVMSLSFIYLLNREQLVRFFGRMRYLLSPRGLFVLDASSPPDNTLVNVFAHRSLVDLLVQKSCEYFFETK